MNCQPREGTSRRRFLHTLGAGALAFAVGDVRSPVKEEQPPNIILILTDDQGYADVGKYGARGFTTPNLDRMAAEGVRFTDFYVSEAVCSASRASLLTGCYAERVGIRGALMPSSTIGLSAGEETIADVLKRKGYATAIFGKWHLGHHREFLPLQHGFDEYAGLPYSNDMWPVGYDGRPLASGRKSAYPPLPFMEGNEQVGVISSLDDQTTLTTKYTERAVRFIERHRNGPFFLYLPHSMPHVPLGVSPRFRGKSAQGMYGDVIMEIDWSAGEILSALRRTGVDQHTLVIFVSDNGPWLNFGNHAGSAVPLREGKGTMWEGGARVPCIMRWPERIPAGRECRKLATTMDLLPTIAAVCDAPLPTHTIDGVNIVPLLTGVSDAEPRDRFYYYYDGELQAVRAGRWKLHFPHAYRSYAGVPPGKDGQPGPYGTGKTELALYDLETDIGEVRDVASDHPDVVARLQRMGVEAREDLGDELTGIQGRGVRPPGRIGASRSGPVGTLAAGAHVELKTLPGSRYAAHGPETLTDGQRGSLDHGDGAWLGFEGTDIEVRIDLGERKTVRRIRCGFLANQLVWIFPPATMEVAVSDDGQTFDVVHTGSYGDSAFNRTPRVVEALAEVAPVRDIRFIRVTARNIKTCPSWHPGAGGSTWLFIDEIIAE
ncbi:MAG: atsA 6 [Bacteroidetes bacterium]|nr:atsA 6 [Bacteroidota bacterium]